MKETTKNYLILGGLVVAVCVMIMFKSIQTRNAADMLADDTVIGNGKPVLLELGSHGCQPCNAMMPILVELSKEQSAFEVGFVDIKTNKAKAEQYNIELIPVQIFFDAAGKELFRHVGFFPKADILDKWQELGILDSPNET